MLALKYNYDLSNPLKKRFLFNNDINSVNILLNMIECEEDIKGLYPKYLSMGELLRRIKSFMKGRPGNDLAARNLSYLIHDDINRLELLVHIEGFKLGHKSINYVNFLEKLILKNIELKQIYKREVFFEEINRNSQINAFKNMFFEEINKEVRSNRELEKLINTYARRLIKPKIDRLNYHLDMQLKMEEAKGFAYLEYENKPFKRSELAILYKNIRKMLVYECSFSFVEAYWQGLIEKLLNRYR